MSLIQFFKEKNEIMISKIYQSIVMGALACLTPMLLLTSCDDELDIVPKGMTTLENVGDLESLLNQEYMLGAAPAGGLGIICNESLGEFMNVAEVLSQPNTLNYANVTYDESIDRAVLATDDGCYQSIYKYINYMNVLISKMDDASGDATYKEQFKAEARIIRAYLHYLAVGIYAKQYDEATAAQEGGIAYVDNTDVSEQKTKLSLAETYERILEDCSDEVISQLPQKNPNVERADQALGNAVRAKVLFQMKRYAEALNYAQASLRLNNAIEDRSTIVETMTWTLTQDTENNLLYIGAGTRVMPTFVTISPETFALFEPGDYVVNYDLMGGWSTMMGEMFSGITGSALYQGWDTMSNPWGVVTDHMYYLAAECLIRTGQVKEGLQMVDRVRAKRVEDYEPFAQDGLSELQAMALLQPAKWVECIASYENFFDCKRWNTEADYRRAITRDLGQYGTFTLQPDSKLWVQPFPANATRYNPSLTQNF